MRDLNSTYFYIVSTATPIESHLQITCPRYERTDMHVSCMYRCVHVISNNLVFDEDATYQLLRVDLIILAK